MSAAAYRRFPSMTSARWAALAVLGLGIAAFPLVDQDQYTLTVMITALILVVLNTSWNFVLGVAGVWNFGQLAIYALGGYGAGLLMLHTGLPAPVAILGGGVASALISVLLAFPTLRLYGIYTSLLTFSFAQVIQFVILNDPGGKMGGTFGLPLVRGLFPSLDPRGSMRAYYWTCLAAAALTLIAIAWIVRSRIGLALRAVRDSLAYGAARGVSALRFRVLAYGIAGFMAGIAGGLYVSFNGTIQPSVMGLTPMSIYVTMLVIGGLGTIWGPVLGTAILMIIQTSLVDHPAIELTILGGVLLVIVVFFPGGLVGELPKVRRRLAAWLSEGEGGTRDDVA